MRTTFTLAAIALSAAATPALADEGEGDWNGAYLGINVGYADTKSDQTVALSGAWTSESAALQSHATDFYATDSHVKDVTVGAQFGYNIQASGGVVIGIEADVNVPSGEQRTFKGPTPTPPFPTLTYTVSNTFDPKLNYGLKGKLGFGSNRTLFYVAGGWSWTQADLAVDITSNGNYRKAASFTHTFDGFQAGAGIEHKVTNGTSLRLEYTYADQGEYTYDTSYVTGSSFLSPAYNETYTQDLKTHAIRLGLNFHF